ncbi:probable mediator of RNA polymerase II transcription subunit 26c [Andrographis paniculata]|uniref:probable mediator of RNA polymerase II transcription subunit 26c n=1 Tax=Andrographis paniculata TaxID=175694 RepID=UPI0021E8E015|nr:probable mediator of RNA polymerase II transcription subunit 26c [Andrographis paniculata]
MDLDGFRSFILDSGIDVWTWIDLAISVASADHEAELKNRRDGIVQKLYATKCRNCDHGVHQNRDSSNDREIEGRQSGGNGIEEGEEEQRKILEIRVLLDDENQSERSLIDLLQMLLDMNISFKALQETDIGRHVTKLRKHPCNEVRRLVKILVRKWKDTVDEWVRLNTPPEEPTEAIDDGKSPNPAGHTAPSKGKLGSESNKQGGGKHFQDQTHQEFQQAKKQRNGAVQITDFHSSNGGSVPIKYW